MLSRKKEKKLPLAGQSAGFEPSQPIEMMAFSDRADTDGNLWMPRDGPGGARRVLNGLMKNASPSAPG